MGLGGASGAAASIPPGSAAKQHDGVSGHRSFPDHVLLGRRADNRADFHPLGHVAGII